MFVQIAHITSRSLILNEKLDEFAVIIGTVSNILYILANSMACHFLYSWAGRKYVESQLTGAFHQTVLGSMDSGVIILSKDSR